MQSAQGYTNRTSDIHQNIQSMNVHVLCAQMVLPLVRCEFHWSVLLNNNVIDDSMTSVFHLLLFAMISGCMHNESLQTEKKQMHEISSYDAIY